MSASYWTYVAPDLELIEKDALSADIAHELGRCYDECHLCETPQFAADRL